MKKEYNLGTFPAGTTIEPIYTPFFDGSEIIESPYEIVQSIIAPEMAYKICELLGLDPNKVNAITLEASGTFQGKDNVSDVLTVKRIKESK